MLSGEPPPPGSIKLAIVDVDGTLVTQDKVLTSQAIEAWDGMRRAGVKLALTSGRPPRGMAMLIGPLGIDTPIAGFNGGVFVNPDLSVIDTHALEPAAARTALKTILDQGLDAWLYTADDWLVRDKDAPHVAREAWTVKFDPKVVDSFADDQLDHAIKIVGVSDDHDLVARCEKATQEAVGETASATRSQPYYLDVTSQKATKAQVVLELCRKLGVAPEAVATFGDMPNDVLMFEKSGFSVAMGNASSEVQARASAVTDTNENDGFAKAVERFILQPLSSR